MDCMINPVDIIKNGMPSMVAGASEQMVVIGNADGPTSAKT